MGWRIRPIICYDLRFPVFCRNNDDYDLLICVANWPEARIQGWDTLLSARAIENMAYTIGVNRVGHTLGNFPNSQVGYVLRLPVRMAILYLLASKIEQ